MVCNINYNPWHSPNSHRPLLPIIRDSVGARRSPASALLRRPIGDVPPLEQPGLSDFTDVKQPKYRVLWELNGSSMGDWREVYGIQWDISPASMKLRNKPFIHFMGRTWGYDGISWVAWVICSTTSQDELFFWWCFSLSLTAADMAIIVQLVHPTMKNLDSSPSHQSCQS